MIKFCARILLFSPNLSTTEILTKRIILPAPDPPSPLCINSITLFENNMSVSIVKKEKKKKKKREKRNRYISCKAKRRLTHIYVRNWKHKWLEKPFEIAYQIARGGENKDDLWLTERINEESGGAQSRFTMIALLSREIINQTCKPPRSFYIYIYMLACTYFFWSGWSKRDYLCTLDCRSRNATRNGNVSPCLPLIPFESLETYQGRFSDREECGLWLAALPLLIESSNRNNLAFSVNYRIVYQVYWNKKINSNNRYVNVSKSIYSANILLWRTGSGKSKEIFVWSLFNENLGLWMASNKRENFLFLWDGKGDRILRKISSVSFSLKKEYFCHRLYMH